MTDRRRSVSSKESVVKEGWLLLHAKGMWRKKEAGWKLRFAQLTVDEKTGNGKLLLYKGSKSSKTSRLVCRSDGACPTSSCPIDGLGLAASAA